MPTSEELLRQAKEQERIEALDRIKAAMKEAEKSVGKCTATHTLRRNYKSIDAVIEKIIGVTVNIYNHKFKGTPLEELTTDVLKSAEVEFVKEVVSYVVCNEPISRQIYLHVGIQYEKVNNHGFFRYELSPTEFDNIKSNMMLKVSDIGRDIRQELPKWDLWINGCEHSADKSKIDRLEQMEFTMFELPKEEMVFLLGWHPFLYGKHIIKSELSVKMIEKRCDEIQDSINRMRGLPYSEKTIARNYEDLHILRHVISLLR